MIGTGLIAGLRLQLELTRGLRAARLGLLLEAEQAVAIATAINPHSISHFKYRAIVAAITDAHARADVAAQFVLQEHRIAEQARRIAVLEGHLSRVLDHLTTLKALSLETVARQGALEALLARVDVLEAELQRRPGTQP